MVAIAMPNCWLRHKVKGTLYPYTLVMASNPSVEEVSEEIAFPEKFMTPKRKARSKTGTLSLATGDTVTAKAKPPKKKTKAALAADASRGL